MLLTVTCAECGEEVYEGMMPRHFDKDHARADEVELTSLDLDGTSPYWQPPVSRDVLEARTRPASTIVVGGEVMPIWVRLDMVGWHASLA